jgi:hypothetical protein
MTTATQRTKFAHTRSIDIDAPLERAWPAMIDYPTWNPGFVDAVVTTIAGTPGGADEITHIQFGDGAGGVADELIAETVRLEEPWHLTWFVSPTGDGEGYVEFLDFGLAERSPSGVTFVLTYYGWYRGADEPSGYLAGKQELLDTLAVSLKHHLEGGAAGG